MNLCDSILLGFIQGMTEFLPISSSGHLVIGSYVLGIKNDDILFRQYKVVKKRQIDIVVSAAISLVKVF